MTPDTVFAKVLLYGTMDQLQDRQNVPIWNAIEASNYKQAVKLVDKRLSKKPTEYLEVCGLNAHCHTHLARALVSHTFLAQRVGRVRANGDF